MKSIAFGFLATAIAATSAIAGSPDVSKDKNPVQPEMVPCFRDHELQLDIFASYMNFPHDTGDTFGNDQVRTNRSHEFNDRKGDHNGGGGGLGVNYFFTRNVGIGADGSFNTNREGTWDYTGKLIIRFPIEHGNFCIAPYIFGGGGGQSPIHRDRDESSGTVMAGLGLEWRATPHIGIFTEGRYTWALDDAEGDSAQARVGLRVAF